MSTRKRKSTPKKRPRPSGDPSEVFELDVTLLGTEPPVWRRFRISNAATLAHLHEVVQIVMGWENAHLHQFETKDGRRFESPHPFAGPHGGLGPGSLDANRVTLAELENELQRKITYEYDFGDGWTHAIQLVEKHPPKEDAQVPVVLEGKQACPPEDCGGVWGYYELLEALADPEHEEHEDRVEWLGDDFDPENYDLRATNQMLRHLSPKT